MDPGLRPPRSNEKLCLLLQAVNRIASSMVEAGFVQARRLWPEPSCPGSSWYLSLAAHIKGPCLPTMLAIDTDVLLPRVIQ